MPHHQENSNVRRLLILKLFGVALTTVVPLLLCLSANQVFAALLLPFGDGETSSASPADRSRSNRGIILHYDHVFAGGEAISLFTDPFTGVHVSAYAILDPVLQTQVVATKQLVPDRKRFMVDLSQDFPSQGSPSNDPEAIVFQEVRSVQPLSTPPSAIYVFGLGLIGILGILLRQEPVLARYKSAENSQENPAPSTHSILILLLSPDAKFAKDIEQQLHRSGYPTRVVPSVEELLTITQNLSPSLVLVDQRVSEWDMLRTDTKLRHVPMITLVPIGTAYTEADSLVDLDRGMDGVHLCQDGWRLLVAKVGSYLWRAGYQQSRRSVCQVGAVELDADTHEVKVGGQQIQLSAKPFAILEAFMQAPSKVFRRSELIDLVWGADFAIGGHTLDVHVHTLRQQLNRDPQHLCRLVTIKGVGFKLKSFPMAIPAASVPDTLPMAANSPPHLRHGMVHTSTTPRSITPSYPRSRRTRLRRICRSIATQVVPATHVCR